MELPDISEVGSVHRIGSTIVIAGRQGPYYDHLGVAVGVTAAGERLWTRSLPSAFNAAQVDDRTLIVAANDGLHKLSTESGEVLASWLTSFTRLLNVGSDQLLVTGEENLTMLDLQGITRWRREVDTIAWKDGAILPDLSCVVVGCDREGKDVVVSRLGSDGNELWTRTFGTAFLDRPRDVVRASSGASIVTGGARDGLLSGWRLCGFGVPRGFVWKLDDDGNTEWRRFFDWRPEVRGESAIEMTGGDVVVAGVVGYWDSTVWLSCDARGELLYFHHSDRWVDVAEVVEADHSGKLLAVVAEREEGAYQDDKQWYLVQLRLPVNEGQSRVERESEPLP